MFRMAPLSIRLRGGLPQGSFYSRWVLRRDQSAQGTECSKWPEFGLTKQINLPGCILFAFFLTSKWSRGLIETSQRKLYTEARPSQVYDVWLRSWSWSYRRAHRRGSKAWGRDDVFCQLLDFQIRSDVGSPQFLLGGILPLKVMYFSGSLII